MRRVSLGSASQPHAIGLRLGLLSGSKEILHVLTNAATSTALEGHRTWLRAAVGAVAGGKLAGGGLPVFALFRVAEVVERFLDGA